MGEKSTDGFSSVEELREAVAAWCGCRPDEVPFTDVMGVPITFLDKYCPEQFEILSCCEPAISVEVLRKSQKFVEYRSRQIVIDGKLCQKTYHRLFIHRK